jgi:hypothetical protein
MNLKIQYSGEFYLLEEIVLMMPGSKGISFERSTKHNLKRRPTKPTL